MRIQLILLVSVLAACHSPKEKETQMILDPHSFARPQQAKVTHLTWDGSIDFDRHIITGKADWSIQSVESSTIVFDTKALHIERVILDDTDTADYTLHPEDPILGRALEVTITPDTKKVTIHYTTSPEAEAVQWLNAQQTAGKNSPFLFTQSQAILARSWIPCQDSPGIRFTYDATVTVPSNLMALMSASNPQEKNDTGVYHFEMKQPIPSYLLALAVGDVSFQSISERSGVYAEPAVIEKATWEFADLEKMIASAEALYGSYQWDRYDVIVLPPSFPFGGMENPRLTFATPTILAGDRSLTSLIAHELAHSWSGNLVTNATWNDFWLNEGFTVYFETRIMEKLYGLDYAEMLASLNLQDLKEEINTLTASGHAADTKLKLDLSGRNPDDGVTNIAYNKGYFFLRLIEEKYGRDHFDAFLKEYFSKHAFQVNDTERFITFIQQYYQVNANVTLPDELFQRWVYGEGLPDDCPSPTATRFDHVDHIMAQWKEHGTLDKVTTTSWSTHEWLHFLKNLPDSLSKGQIAAIDNFGNFTASGNAEIIAAWGVIAIKNDYEKMYPVIESFLINTGRRKFLMPLYTEMVKTDKGKAMAKEIYSKARPNYHFVSVNSLDKLLMP